MSQTRRSVSVCFLSIVSQANSNPIVGKIVSNNTTAASSAIMKSPGDNEKQRPATKDENVAYPLGT